MKLLTIKSETEFLTLWEALGQYVQNVEEVEGDNPKQDEKLSAARDMLERFDAEVVRLTGHDAKEAADHLLKPGLVFRDLEIGDRFRFPGDSTTNTRTRGGYVRPDGRKFRTGAKTAVILSE